MPRLQSMLKTFFIVFFIGFLLLLFLFIWKKSFSFSIDKDSHHSTDHSNSLYRTNRMLSFSTNVKVIPLPHSIVTKPSGLLLSDGFRIISKQTATADLQSAIARYTKYISLLKGISTDTNQYLSIPENTLTIDCLLTISEENEYPKLGEDESYKLNIIETGSYLSASSLTGVIRGLSTFVQLIERDTSTGNSYVPFVDIVDRPRFVWRGLMLDVSRHWMPVAVIERTLNAMELSKLNVLHLHLSDDQGFRVQSIQYPLLHDKKFFFTQKDIQYLVEYARQRRIRIVPEFDIPGHTTSWFVGYPELATEPGPYKVETQWGMMKPTMDPTKESTYTFLDGFFGEMTKLFPDPYFHIGGDEVEGSQWDTSPTVEKFIQENQLRDKHGLQAYFNKRIQKLLNQYGKSMIGWEEILEKMSGNLAIDNDAIIQSWMNRKSLISAVTKGYKGLLSNGYYLDHLSSSTFHYKVDPILRREIDSLNKEQLSNILGGEACMWSEYVSETTVDSRIWPRVLAVAERLWSSSTVTNETFLYERLFRMNHLLDKIQTGVTHLSSYKLQLQNLILDPNKKNDLLHPFTILADVCEPHGMGERSHTRRYSSHFPLTTFTDALQCESELIWKLEHLSMNDATFRDIFQTWSVNHLRLRQLFDDVDKNKNKKVWVQDVEQLSSNLAQTGQIGLRILDYRTKKILHHDTNHTMNSWTLSHWISHHQQLLNHLENGVNEVRLAAVRPVRRLLNSVKNNV